MKDRAHSVLLRYRKPATVFVCLGAALSLTACGSSGDSGDQAEDSPTPTRPPATTAPADPQVAVKQKAIATYQAYWQEMEKLYADPTGKSAHLDLYAASEALQSAEADARSTRDRGLVINGNVSLSDQDVTEVDLSGQVPNATVSACLDISRWVTANAKSGKLVSLPEDRLTAYKIISVVEKYPEGWRVTRDEPQGKAC
ncbi:hypothetical protein STENM223S_03208 [Streptomyces tendae]